MLPRSENTRTIEDSPKPPSWKRVRYFEPLAQGTGRAVFPNYLVIFSRRPGQIGELFRAALWSLIKEECVLSLQHCVLLAAEPQVSGQFTWVALDVSKVELRA